MTTLEDIKKSLIRDQESFEEKELISLGQKINNICTLDGKGNVNFHRNLTDKDKIKFALASRFIARKIQDFFNEGEESERIRPFMTTPEMEKMLRISNAQVRARLSDLRKENLIEGIERGEYKIKSLMIYKILENEN